MTTQNKMSVAEWTMLLSLSVLWGGSFFFNGVIVRDLPPLTTVAARVGLAAVILLIVLKATGVPLPRSKSVWAALFGTGLLNNVIPFSLIVWGQTHIASGLAAIFNATTPLFTVLAAHVLTSDERLNFSKIIGVVSGLTGVAAMAGAELLAGLSGNWLAQFAIIGAAISYAFAGIFGKRFKKMGVKPIATAAGQVTASTIILLPIALLVDMPWRLGAPSGETMAALFGLAAFSTALAYFLFFRILASGGATNVMLVTLLVPVSAVILGVMFLNERLEPEHVTGMGLIAFGLLAIDGRLFSRLYFRRSSHNGGFNEVGKDI